MLIVSRGKISSLWCQKNKKKEGDIIAFHSIACPLKANSSDIHYNP